jgi:outer membrane protein
MFKTRILLIVGCAVIVWLIFLLPKVVVHNDDELATPTEGDSSSKTGRVAMADMHGKASDQVLARIRSFRVQFQSGSSNEKNAIFADSLAKLYQETGKFDSSAWFAEEAAKVQNTTESWVKAGDSYYQAYTFALDPGKQGEMARKTQEIYNRVLQANPKNLEAKTKMAMTYLSSSSPMQGISLLREVLAEDPKNELALFNMGMLSIQSGQYGRAVERLEELIKVNPAHTQGQLLLGIAWMNSGEKEKARGQFEKVKQMDKDPAVQATADSYLKDLK